MVCWSSEGRSRSRKGMKDGEKENDKRPGVGAGRQVELEGPSIFRSLKDSASGDEDDEDEEAEEGVAWRMILAMWRSLKAALWVESIIRPLLCNACSHRPVKSFRSC